MSVTPRPAHIVVKCSGCGRESLVIMLFYGKPQSKINEVVCGVCLKKRGLNVQWARLNPMEATRLQKWLSKLEKIKDEELICPSCGHTESERNALYASDGLEWYECLKCGHQWSDLDDKVEKKDGK